MKYSSFLSLASILPATYGVAHPGPQPTAGGPERAIGGIAPATTAAPSVEALEKRQQNIINPLCGWVDGNWESALTCSASRTCMLYKSAAVGMAGCCLGSNLQNCGWANSCVPYAQMTAGNCGSNCIFNSFVRKCTNSAAPYCQTYTYLNDGIKDYDCGTANTIYTVRNSASDPSARQTRTIRLSTVAAAQVTGVQEAVAVGKKAVKLAIGAIIGIVVAVLFLIFCIVIGICICLKRKKKQKALAQNAQIVASNQANRQSQYQPQIHPQNVQQSQPLLQQHGMPPPQQQMMPGQPYASPPMPSQSPAPQMGYFPPAGQKFDGHTSVHEYAMSPISNPPTPAPAYSQPYVAQNVPPMPQQVPQQQQPPPGVVAPMQQYRAPAGGAVEVDAVSVPHVPGQTGYPGQPGQPGPHVYEMGQGR